MMTETPAYSYAYQEQVSQTDRNWAAASHWGTLVAAWLAMGFLAPLAIMFTVGQQSPFVRRHAVESLNFQISMLIYNVVAGILCLIAIGFVLLAILHVLNVVFVIIAAMRASEGEMYRYPLTLRLIS